MARKKFAGVRQDGGRGGGRWIAVPFDAKAAFGEARAPVCGSVNGTPIRTRLAAYGAKAYLGLTREVRAEAGLDVGDRMAVVLERDDAPRVVEVPPELAAAFRRDKVAAKVFDALSFTHRKEYVRWVAEAKKEETRLARAAKSVTMLREGVKHP
jgi:hypothetical protein